MRLLFAAGVHAPAPHGLAAALLGAEAALHTTLQQTRGQGLARALAAALAHHTEARRLAVADLRALQHTQLARVAKTLEYAVREQRWRRSPLV